MKEEKSTEIPTTKESIPVKKESVCPVDVFLSGKRTEQITKIAFKRYLAKRKELALKQTHIQWEQTFDAFLESNLLADE